MYRILCFTILVALAPVSALTQKALAPALTPKAPVTVLESGDIRLSLQMSDGVDIPVVVTVRKIDEDCISRACSPTTILGEPILWGSDGVDYPLLNYITKLTIGPEVFYLQIGFVGLSCYSDLTNITAVSFGTTTECQVLIEGGHESSGYTACLSIDEDGHLIGRTVTGSLGSKNPDEKTIYSKPREYDR